MEITKFQKVTAGGGAIVGLFLASTLISMVSATLEPPPPPTLRCRPGELGRGWASSAERAGCCSRGARPRHAGRPTPSLARADSAANVCCAAPCVCANLLLFPRAKAMHDHHVHVEPEYAYMKIRNKPFPWGDGDTDLINCRPSAEEVAASKEHGH